ncbi:MAG: exodeoxyribonuclease VII small subunit [Deltaproteobacteria bacterium]|nr:exodeoxyribonuclease VII small subunit [Deltaproteobacteria bacterium]
MSKKKGDQFEESLKRLQTIVERLEKGDVPLEEAMNSFTEGIRLAQSCHRKLEEAENRLRMVLKDEQGAWTTIPFEPASSENPVE